MFAHETAHSWQPQVDDSGMPDLLLFAAMREGMPDYLAGMVLGATPSPEREAVAQPRERALKAQAIRELLELKDPEAILTASGYSERMNQN